MKLLTIENLKTFFPIFGGVFHRKIAEVLAVNDVSFDVYQGETLGLVGESGCGKSTLGRTIMRLYEPDAGRIIFNDQDITHSPNSSLKSVRRSMQMVFQDPFGSLDPRMTVFDILEEPFRIHKLNSPQERKVKIDQMMDLVGLSQDALKRYPHEFSGGQRQRLGIARAIMLEPSLVIADEPVSALDVSIQSQILNLLKELQKQLGLTYIFIAHNLAVVKHMSDRIAVMYLGKLVEIAPGKALYQTAKHPYTQALISAIPSTKTGKKIDRIILEGDVPSPINPPSGCSFHPRCPKRTDRCMRETPRLNPVSEKHFLACHHSD